MCFALALATSFADLQAAGRALSAYNLVIFAGVFCVQSTIGLAVDALGLLGWDTQTCFQGAVALLGLCCLWVYAIFLRRYRRTSHRARG